MPPTAQTLNISLTKWQLLKHNKSKMMQGEYNRFILG